MSPVAVGLDLLLIALLLVALGFGLRLDRRLKALRESQAGFVKAVGELDSAAGRAEAGLDTLRRATDAARVELTERLDEARDLIRRLERVSGEASARTPEARPTPTPFTPALAAAAPAARVAPAAAPGPDDLFDQEAELAAALRELRRRRSAE